MARRLLQGTRMRREPGFTLIELMIVLGIIAVGAALAFGAVNNQLPSMRTNAATRDTAMAIQQARSRAIRTGVPHKLCIFRSASTGKFAGRGGYVLLACQGTTADPACSLAADLQVCADDADGVDNSKVCDSNSTCPWDFPTTANVPNDTVRDIRMPNVERIFADSSLSGYKDVSLTVLRQDVVGTPYTTQPWLELGFTTIGTINQSTTTKNGGGTPMTNGGLDIESVDPGASASKPVRKVKWNLAGGVKVTR